LEVVPGGARARVRGLQTHRQRIARAVPGSRVAINLGGVDAGTLARGLVVARPGALRATSLLTARATILSSASRPLSHDATVKAYLGTAERVARVSVLGGAEIAPGTSGWIQLRLAEPVAAVVGDRFVLRTPSPPETIGGGVVTDVEARRLRRTAATIASLERAASSDIDERIVSLLATPLTPVELARRVESRPADVASRVETEIAAGRIVELEPFLLSAQRYAEIAARADAVVDAYHAEHPLRVGMPKEELRGALRLDAKIWGPLLHRLVRERHLDDRGPAVARPGHHVELPAAVERIWMDARRRLAAAEAEAPSTAELGLDAEAVAALAERGDLVRLTPEIALLPSTVRRFATAIVEEASTHGRISVSRARDLTGSSRKYVLPLLQFLDNARVTRRAGDDRVLAAPIADARARLDRAIAPAHDTARR
jgi:selenocysteine-specific elongation factor